MDLPVLKPYFSLSRFKVAILHKDIGCIVRWSNLLCQIVWQSCLWIIFELIGVDLPLLVAGLVFLTLYL